MITTAAESPFSNGICERHNAVIGNMLDKIMDENNSVTLEVALAWAINAKNSLQNVYGFTPAQLVFGRNPNLPSVLTDKLPALEGKTTSETVANHLIAKHQARKAFIESEASEKVRRALRHNIRESTTLNYKQGDKVFYKRQGCSHWKGPGEIIGKDGHQLLVKHGGSVIRVHPVSARLTQEVVVGATDQLDQEEHVRRGQVDLDETRVTPIIPSVEFASDDDEPNENVESVIEAMERLAITTDDSDKQNNKIHEEQQSKELVNKENEDETHRNKVPPMRANIEYRLCGDEDWQKAVVLNRAGKATGRHKMWLNVEDVPQKDQKSVDFNLAEWKFIDESVLFCGQDTHEIMEAKQKEIENLRKHGVFTELPDVGQDFIESRWVVTEKIKEGQRLVKARLVAKGFQEKNSEIKTDSPTCMKENLRVLLMLSATYKWTIKSIDIKCAYLQGREIDRTLYMKPPPEAGRETVWLLKKALYGLNDAARVWYLKVKETMFQFGAVKSKFDESVFFWKESDKLVGAAACHVDDFLLFGKRDFIEKIAKNLKDKFLVSSENESAFKYLGLELKQSSSGFLMSQKRYIDEIHCIQDMRRQDEKLDKYEMRNLRALAGQLNWIGTHTRPDVAYDICEVNTSIKDATQVDIMRANKVVKKMQLDDLSLRYTPLGKLEESTMVCYSDASLGNLRGNASQGGYLIFVFGCNGNKSLLTWQSKKIRRVVKSTIAAEALALQEVANHCVVLRSFIEELTTVKLPTKINCDNKSLVQSLHSTNTLTDKRLNMDIMVVQDMIQQNEIDHVNWIPTNEQLANCLTKKGALSSSLLDLLKH